MKSEVSKREMQVLALLVSGLSDLQIAQALSIQDLTVKDHIKHIKAKLYAPTRCAVVTLAFQSGLIDIVNVVVALQQPKGKLCKKNR